MSVKTTVANVIAGNPLGRHWLEHRRLQQRQRDWTTTHRSKFATTRLTIHTTVGIGDCMVAKQVCQEFVRYCEAHGDPKLGHIVITGGAWPLEFSLTRGDHNVYWWWSMNGQDDWLDRYLAHTSSKPDVVACLSSWSVDYARRLGSRTIYLPLAVGDHFQYLGIARDGIGYAGSKGHKDTEQVARIIGPFAGDPNFEWASGFSQPQQICEFYNRKQIVLGMTEIYQERAGMVNNRVYEVLATGTPFILQRHRALDEVLEQHYPYQSGSAEETRRMADEILADFPKHLAVIEQFRKIVDAKHRYKNRLSALVRFLAEKG